MEGRRHTGISVVGFIVVFFIRPGLLADEVPVFDFFEVDHCVISIISEIWVEE